MKCLSVIQPWATLVVLGAKSFATRRWHTAYRGPLAIHASRTFPETARALCLTAPFRSVLRRAGYRQSADLARGAVIGTVELVECLPAQAVLESLADHSPGKAFGDYAQGRWAWRLANPAGLAVPIPLAGRPGLFEVAVLDDSELAAVAASCRTLED